MSYPTNKKKGLRPGYEGGEPHYTSGKKSNPHASPSKKLNSFYKDHGKGSHHGEEDIEDEDRIQEGKSKKIW